MMVTERIPTEQEINAVITALDQISAHINCFDGKINASGWREVHRVLAGLSDYELWLGVCNLEDALFGSDENVNSIHATLYELFSIAYDQGIDAL